MKRLIIPLSIFLLVTLACMPTAGAKNTPVPDVAPSATPLIIPTVTPVTEIGAITNVDDAEKAVVQILVEGSFEYPAFGSFAQVKSGSGFVIDPDGTIVTNNHVVTGAARIKVYFSDDDTAYNAKLLGTSECSDLAVIKISGDPFPYLKWFGDDPSIGQDVFSLGYPADNPQYTRHAGAISKRKQSIDTSWASVENAVEHDAKINPGNSGGPLVTRDAQVVGINYSSTQGLDNYYAITTKEALPILDELRNGNSVHSIGINGEGFITDDGSLYGIWVYSVKSGSPADQTGVKPGDIIVEFESIPVGREGTMQEYCDVLRAHEMTDTMQIKVLRYKTGEVLEGQINGRKLEVVSSGGGTTGGQTDSGTTTSGDYFTDEFNAGVENWRQLVAAGDSSKSFIETIPGRLRFVLPSSETYVYAFNNAYSYADVYVESEFETMGGGGKNGVSLVCRYSDRGFYEMRVSTIGDRAGFLQLFRYDSQLKAQKKNPYVELLSKFYRQDAKPVTELKTGYGTNKIGMLCSGNNIAVYANGKALIDLVSKDPIIIQDDVLTEGFTGIGVESFSGGKVLIEFEYFATGAPK